MTAGPLGYSDIAFYLGRLYDCELFSRHGIAHPVAVFKPAATQVHDIDSLLDPAPPTPEARDFASYDHGYLQDLLNSKAGLYNGATVTMKSLRQNPLRLRGALGRYYDMLASCAALERELRDAAAQGGFRAPARAAYHRVAAPDKSLTQGAFRSAAIGISVLTVFKASGDYQALLARRSRQTAIDSGKLHLLPAMMFDPATGDAREWSVKHQIFRETLEELFGMPEIRQPARWDFFYAHPALRYLLSLLESGAAQLCACGICLNLLTLRPEICALLLIHAPEWQRRVSAPDSDMPLTTAAETVAGSMIRAPIASDAAFLAKLPPAPHLRMPAHATAAMWLAIDRARQEIARRAG